MSPSTRRAWIEIKSGRSGTTESSVALHPEGVDRNTVRGNVPVQIKVALHPEGVDRNTRCRTTATAARVALHPEGVDRNQRF